MAVVAADHMPFGKSFGAVFDREILSVGRKNIGIYKI